MQLISVFVLTRLLAQSHYFLYTNFQVSSHLLLLYNLICVGPVQNPKCRFALDAALSHFE